MTRFTADQALLDRLEAFELDEPDATLTFSRRLARENGWAHPFALRVVQEYKRFVYLAMTAGHQVTPSDEVDQAWHLHLTYTCSYWGVLCREVLGRPLHHGPTKGGQSEGQRFENQYEQTLASYREAFGQSPPIDVWPPTEARFGDAAAFVRVNRARAWVLPKPWRVDHCRPLVLAASLAALAPPLAAGAAWNPLDFPGSQFLTFYGVLAALAIIGSLACRLVLRSPDDGRDPPGTDELLKDPISVAALRGGWQSVYQTSLAELVADGSIAIEKPKGRASSRYVAVAKRQPQASDNDLQRLLLSQCAVDAEFGALGKAARPVAMQQVEQLEQHGLLETSQSFRSPRFAAALLLGSVWLLGLFKLVVGVGRDKPVGFLFIGLAVLIGVFAFFWSKPHRSRRGERRWRGLLKDHATLKGRAKKQGDSLGPAELALTVGLFGVAAAGATELDPLRGAIAAASPGSGGDSGCGDGGSGDGGCGGGGCGGCGGCGG
ncbi:hypothetical protein Pla175_20950 [Pirellulimonas nuda]|uniref:TIGR04222 domain protein n=1 Tax=Pirellulimonas nuda TaxID=2528009 RepID=A0A518DB54_9BACT|nr:TIGR04222 domain-containing membrane protein [Pirellulimonas nuda]QDU88714.1 hypothetical protein Pla175_20950 [Pirellulimonas nuda]